MQKLIVWNRKRLLISTSLLLLLVFALAACSNGGFSAAAAVTSSPAQTTLPTARTGARSCPAKVGDPSYWDHTIGTHGDAKVENVTCGKIMQYPGIQVLATVRHHSHGFMLDVYVYANILDPHPTQFFNLPGLNKGEAKISGYNTVLTAEVDLNSSLNKGKPYGRLKRDLFREFKWSDGAGAFEQTFVPGMFPNLTRYQAEADQAKVNQGHDPWKLDAVMTTKAALTLLNRDSNSIVTVLSGGGPHDVTAVVKVVSPPPIQGITPIIVTLSRLEGNSNGGIWEIVAAKADAFSITLPQSGARINSPSTVTGTGPSFEGQVGKVVIVDHLYNNIGSAFAMVINPGEPFSVNVTYTSSFQVGAQEGIVQLIETDGAGSAGAVMVKILIS
jgi:hypothetical protein